VAGNVLHLNFLVRDMVNVHRYHLRSVEILVQFSDEAVVTKFIETLLLLRNIVITNLSLLYHASISTLQDKWKIVPQFPLHEMTTRFVRCTFFSILYFIFISIKIALRWLNYHI